MRTQTTKIAPCTTNTHCPIVVRWFSSVTMKNAPATGPNRKHPSLAVNAAGETLLAWTEGMSWKKGGSLAWQVYDRNGKVKGTSGSAAGVPAFSLIAAFARPDGGFTVVY